MKKLSDIVFLDSYPSIDLHGLDRDLARVMTNDFVNDNYKMGNEIFVIIHGIGAGILRKEVYDTLKNNKKVIEYKTDYFNNGCTIVRIKTKDK